MSSVTRWVLAHQRMVIVGWVVLTIAGIAVSGPASERPANDGSVPHKTDGTLESVAAEGTGTPAAGRAVAPAAGRNRRGKLRVR